MIDFIRKLVEEYDRGHLAAGMVDAAVTRRVVDDLVGAERTEWLTGGTFREPLLTARYTLHVEMNAQTMKVTSTNHGSLSCDRERCEAPVVHAEHYYGRVRGWCEEHTPWSGHFEHCGDACKALVAGKAAGDRDELQ